jgi:hypothetical protein
MKGLGLVLRRRAENGNWRLEVQDAGNGTEIGNGIGNGKWESEMGNGIICCEQLFLLYFPEFPSCSLIRCMEATVVLEFNWLPTLCHTTPTAVFHFHFFLNRIPTRLVWYVLQW